MSDIHDVTSPRVLRDLFQQYGLKPNRQLGQNFLIDANIARKIIAALELQQADAVIEVGPGAGALTFLLARSGVDSLVLEIDRGLALLLKDLLQPWPLVRIINRDVLKVKWHELIAEHFTVSQNVKLLSNLPYVISGPFMYTLFKEGFPFNRAVLMFQKEVADRLTASPGASNYGALSVISGYFAEGKILFNTSSKVFWPRPKVDSAVIALTPKKRYLRDDVEKHFFFLVQAVFQQRRKTMLNNISRAISSNRSQSVKLLEEASIEPTARPEELSVKQFAMLASITYNYSIMTAQSGK